MTGTPRIALGRASFEHKVDNSGTYGSTPTSETGERKAGPGPMDGHINDINPLSRTMVGTTTLTLTPPHPLPAPGPIAGPSRPTVKRVVKRGPFSANSETGGR